MRVLFIGNSYVYVNDLPRMFAGLAEAGGHPVETGMLVNGGWTLAAHAGSERTRGTIGTNTWDYVVLQEQSQTPAFEQPRTMMMFPAARQLARMIRTGGATPLFFLTWGHRDGAGQYGIPDYTTMQTEITRGYTTIADELTVPLAPVGVAWAQVRRRHPNIALWQDDGSHPSPDGTYLAACVFYATVFATSPVGLGFTADRPTETARQLQTVAAEAVLTEPGRWRVGQRQNPTAR